MAQGSSRNARGIATEGKRRGRSYGTIVVDLEQRRRAAGEPLIAIARAMKLAHGTVRGYAHATSFPERSTRRPGHSIIDQHLPHLQARVAEGCEGCRRAVARVAGARLYRQGEAGTELAQRTTPNAGQDRATPMAWANASQFRLRTCLSCFSLQGHGLAWG